MITDLLNLKNLPTVIQCSYVKQKEIPVVVIEIFRDTLNVRPLVKEDEIDEYTLLLSHLITEEFEFRRTKLAAELNHNDIEKIHTACDRYQLLGIPKSVTEAYTAILSEKKIAYLDGREYQ